MMETKRPKKQKLVKRSEMVSDCAITALQLELGVSKAAIKAAISAVGMYPDRIAYYVKAN